MDFDQCIEYSLSKHKFQDRRRFYMHFFSKLLIFGKSRFLFFTETAFSTVEEPLDVAVMSGNGKHRDHGQKNQRPRGTGGRSSDISESKDPRRDRKDRCRANACKRNGNRVK